MVERELNEMLDFSIFENKRVCIQEVLPLNVDFLILDLLKHIQESTLFSFYETKLHFLQLAEARKMKIAVKSVFTDEYCQNTILDDIYTAKAVFGLQDGAKFNIYRSNTCKVSEWYNYDIIMSVYTRLRRCS